MSEKTLTTTRGHPRGRKRSAVVMALSLMSLMLFATPVGAAPSGTVDATITVEGPCITLPSGPLDFGAIAFSIIDSNSQTSIPTPTVITACSEQAMNLYAIASDATGSGTGAWTLGWGLSDGLVCGLGDDIFGAGLKPSASSAVKWLTSAADTFIGGGNWISQSVYPWLTMPCSGSTGVGETMTFGYTFIATIP